MIILDYLATILSFLKQPKKRNLIKLTFKFKNKTGLEIGGPSSIFGLKGYVPVYLFAKQIDGVNFSTKTVWEGEINEGKNYEYYNYKKGYQYISEANNLSNIRANKYDFILSCHSLEHMANPIKALKEWRRVLKPNGSFILVLPDKEHTFDKNRPYTEFEHLLDDYQNNVCEDDKTHFEEVLTLHDITKDQGVNNLEDLKARTINNLSNRCVHHHVFCLTLIKEMLEYIGIEIVYQQKADPFHLITIAKRVDVK